jgi:hypothetical protein
VGDVLLQIPFDELHSLELQSDSVRFTVVGKDLPSFTLHTTRSMHSLCTHYALTMHSLCTHYALTVHSLCTH